MKWKDISSYSQNDTDRKPTTFEAVAGEFRLVVWWNSRVEPYCWVGHMTNVFDNHYFDTLNYNKLEQAKTRVVKMARTALSKALKDLGTA